MNRATRNREIAYIGIGGNVGDVLSNLQSALTFLQENDAIAVEVVSHLYKTPPWGMLDQDWFLNACARLSTTLEPVELLEQCLEAEKKLKRTRGKRWGPRNIDVDLLLYGDEVMMSEKLQLPHPRMASRAFVLMPLCDLDPDLKINSVSVSRLLKSADANGIELFARSEDWWPVREK